MKPATNAHSLPLPVSLNKDGVLSWRSQTGPWELSASSVCSCLFLHNHGLESAVFFKGFHRVAAGFEFGARSICRAAASAGAGVAGGIQQ